MENKIVFNAGSLYIQLFKIQASINTLIETTLTDEQKEKFNANYHKKLDAVIRDFSEQFPDEITGLDDKRKEFFKD